MAKRKLADIVPEANSTIPSSSKDDESGQSSETATKATKLTASAEDIKQDEHSEPDARSSTHTLSDQQPDINQSPAEKTIDLDENIPDKTNDTSAKRTSSDKGNTTQVKKSGNSPSASLPKLEPTEDRPNTSLAVVKHIQSHDIRVFPYHDDSTLQRLCTFLDWNSPVNNSFSVMHVPHNTDWASASTSKERNLFCKKSTQPITFWLPGTVKSRYFFSAAGNPLERVSVTVIPSTVAAFQAAKQILARFSGQPTTNVVAGDGIRVSRWQTTMERGTPWNVVKPFDRAYDATDKFTNKADMPLIGPADIHFDDTVLVEATVSRYHPRDNDHGWQAAFNLQAISMLARAPEVNSEPIVDTDDFSAVL